MSTSHSSTSPDTPDSDSASDDSEDELFYDAIEASGTLISRYLNQNRPAPADRGDLTLVPCDYDDSPAPAAPGSSAAPVAPPSPTVIEEDPETATARLRKFEETRRRLHVSNIEGEDETAGAGAGTPDDPEQSSSQTSSMDGLYPNRHSRPFKVIEQDSISLSHSARGLALSSSSSGAGGAAPGPGQTTPTNANPKPPDIISSCVASTSTKATAPTVTPTAPVQIPAPVLAAPAPEPPLPPIQLVPQPPVPPPRRKKRSKSPTISIVSSACLEHDKSVASPTAITFGVVTAQDEEKTRSKSSGPRVLRRTESLGMSGGSFGSGAAVSGLATPDISTPNASVPGAAGDSQSSATKIPPTATGGGSLPSQGSNSSGSGGSGSSGFYLRTKTDSGRMLSDLEILKQVTVLNLDTGERVPLSSAEDKIPKCINPLSLHIMRLTSEYVGEDEKSSVSDDDSSSKKSGTSESIKRRGLKIKKLFNDVRSKAIVKARQFKTRSMHGASGADSQSLSNFDTTSLYSHAGGSLDQPLPPMAENPGTTTTAPAPAPAEFKLKFAHKNKGPYDFENLTLVQDLSTEHSGPIWCMKFSNCGRLLATAGQDRTIRVWVLKSQMNYFQDVIKASKVSPTPSMESVPSPSGNEDQSVPASSWPFVPLSTYSGHTADLLDIAWSKSFFLLSSSMDRTVRLWHISRKECLCCFQHIDFVTAIAFHPRDDRYFLSGSLDGKLRLWNIPDKKVALWNEVPGPNNLITTANFCQNGKFAVVGTYDGRCIFYHTEQLKYHTQIILNKKKLGKITGIEPMPGEDKILVTSNDSRIRLYDLRDLSLTCKFTGVVVRSSQIKASFSHDGKYIISGSENSFIYIWKSSHEQFGVGIGFPGRGARRDRNSYWEGVKAHNAVVTCAIFAPDPDLIIKEMEPPTNYSPLGYVLASADFTGSIKVFISRTKQKCSSLPASAIPAI